MIWAEIVGFGWKFLDFDGNSLIPIKMLGLMTDQPLVVSIQVSPNQFIIDVCEETIGKGNEDGLVYLCALLHSVPL